MIPAGFQSDKDARAAGYIPGHEAAKVSRLSLSRLHALSRSGDAPTPTRVGHAYWWSKQEVTTWAQTRTRIRERGAPAPLCSARSCKRPAVSRGLCLMHYKRARSGRPKQEHMVGDPIGAGQWGILNENEEGIACHECGRRFHGLGIHVYTAHGITAAEYRDAYGLPRGTPLASKRTRETYSQRALENDSTRLLDQYRDPVKASRSRGPDAFDAMAQTRRGIPVPDVIHTMPLHDEHETLMAAYLTTRYGITKQNHMYDLRLWVRWLEAQNIYILAARRREVDRWVSERRDSGLSLRTIHGNISSVRGFYRWAIEEEYTSDDPTRYTRVSSPPRVDRKFLSLPDTRRLLERSLTFKNGLLAPQIHLWALSGLRPGEPRKLLIEDFEFYDGKPTLLVDASKTPGRERLTLPKSTATLLDKAAAERKNGPLILNPHTGKAWTGANERVIFYQLLEDAGLPTITPYSLRVGFITHALGAGINERLVMISARHSSTAATTYYDRLRDKIERSVGVEMEGIIEAQRPTGRPRQVEQLTGRRLRFFSEDSAYAAGYIPTTDATALLGIGHMHLLALARKETNPPPAPALVRGAYWWHRDRLLAWNETRPRRSTPTCSLDAT